MIMYKDICENCKFGAEERKRLLEECDSVIEAVEAYREFIVECKKNCKYQATDIIV